MVDGSLQEDLEVMFKKLYKVGSDPPKYYEIVSPEMYLIKHLLNLPLSLKIGILKDFYPKAIKGKKIDLFILYGAVFGKKINLSKLYDRVGSYYKGLQFNPFNMECVDNV
jgi:hypothetical protein